MAVLHERFSWALGSRGTADFGLFNWQEAYHVAADDRTTT